MEAAMALASQQQLRQGAPTNPSSGGGAAADRQPRDVPRLNVNQLFHETDDEGRKLYYRLKKVQDDLDGKPDVSVQHTCLANT